MSVNWLDSFLNLANVALMVKKHILSVELVSKLSTKLELLLSNNELLIKLVFSNQRALRVLDLCLRLNVEEFAHFLAGLGIKEVNEGLRLEYERIQLFSFVLLGENLLLLLLGRRSIGYSLILR